MEYIFENFQEGYPSEALDIFSGTTIQTGIISKEIHEYSPLTSIRKDSPLTFQVSGTGATFIDMRNTRLYLETNITNEDGSPIDDTDSVSVINAPGFTIFSKVDLLIQQIMVATTLGINYSFKSLMDILIPHKGCEIHPSVLESALYTKDPGGTLDNIEIPGSNTGLLKRSQYYSNGKTCELEANLFHDFALSSRFLPFGLDLIFKFYTQSDDFIIITNSRKKYKFNILNAVLKVCRVNVNPNLIAAQSDMLKKQPAIFPFLRSDIKTYSIPQNLTKYVIDDITQGTVPSRVLVAIVEQRAYSPGNTKTNPFNFEHMYVDYIAFTVDGKSVPGEPLQVSYSKNDPEENIFENNPGQPAEEPANPPNANDPPVNDPGEPPVRATRDVEPPHYPRSHTFRNRRDIDPNYKITERTCLKAYTRLYDAFDTSPHNPETHISREEFAAGYTIYRFQIGGPDARNYHNLIKKGHTRLIIGFNKPLHKPITIIVYSTLLSVVQIDAARNITIRD